MQNSPSKLLAAIAAAAILPSAMFAATAAPSLSVDGNSRSFAVEVKVPGIDVVAEGQYSLLSIPGHALRMEAGNPELPVITASVMLPDSGRPSVRLEVLEEETIQLPSAVAPSRGHITRDIALSSVPRVEGPVYQSGKNFPAESFQAEIGNPYLLREVRGAAIRVNPVIFNTANNTIRLLKKARVHIDVAGGDLGFNGRERESAELTSDFMPLYQELFLNAPAHPILDLNSENAGSGLIIAHIEWVSNMQPLQDWRDQKGFKSELVAFSDVRDLSNCDDEDGDDSNDCPEGPVTADELKSYLQKRYDEGGLAYVLLVGDAEHIPSLKGEMEGADCDACYAKLEGNDHVPDLFMSRFVAKTAADVDTQVARAIQYERNPQVGAAAKGYLKGTGIASNEGSPPDYDRTDLLRIALEDWRFTHWDKLYDQKGYNTPKATPEQVTEAVNDGRSIIAYMGHGSKTAWVSSKFNVNHAKNLQNDKIWPMIWDVACVNGDFVGGSDSFAEAWAKAGTAQSPRGAIGIVAATTNMSWHPPVDWQNHVITKFMIPGKTFTGGAMHHFGLVKAMEKWGDDANSQGVMMVEQCIFFGDSSVQIRSDIPRQLAVAPVAVGAGEDKVFFLEVKHDNKAVQGARVVLNHGENRWVGFTDDIGRMEMPALDGVEAPTFSCTVTGPNLVPFIDQAVVIK